MLNAIIISALVIIGQGAPGRVRQDAYLVAPGIGAEMVLLGESEADVIARKGQPEKTASFDTPRDVFSDALGSRAPFPLPFMRMAWYESGRCAIFYNEGRVSAIAGTDMERVTADSVDLRRGVEYFTYGYGNSDRAIIEKEGNQLYLYRSVGIAIADDGNDGTIDLYVIFAPRTER